MASRSDQLEVPKEAHSSSSRSKRLYQNPLITLCVKGLCGHTLLRVVHASDLRLPCVARNSNFRRPRPGLHSDPTDVDDEIRFQSSCPNFVHAHSLYVHTNLTFHHFFPMNGLCPLVLFLASTLLVRDNLLPATPYVEAWRISSLTFGQMHQPAGTLCRCKSLFIVVLGGHSRVTRET